MKTSERRILTTHAGSLPRREYCRGKIAHYKVPRYVKFVDGFPMTLTGKAQKFVMREASVKELGLEAAARVKMA
jgi:fatty-acyl-CoA synthase